MGSVKENILLLRKKGKSFDEISKELNCSQGYISTVCSKSGLSNIGLNKVGNLSDDELLEISEYYKIHSKKDTLEKFGISDWIIRKYKLKNRKVLPEEERGYTQVKKYRLNKKEKAVEYKGGKCVLCGYNRCLKALDFHHIDPTKKDFTISKNTNLSWEKTKNELDKCVLVCANCHREIHSGLVNIEV